MKFHVGQKVYFTGNNQEPDTLYPNLMNVPGTVVAPPEEDYHPDGSFVMVRFKEDTVPTRTVRIDLLSATPIKKK